MTGRAYRQAAAHQFEDARLAFDAVAEQTGSYEAVVGSIDMQIKAGQSINLKCTYNNPGATALTWGEDTADEMCLDFFYVTE